MIEIHNSDLWKDPRVRQVKPGASCAYLLAHGWKPRPYPRPQVRVFNGPLLDNGQPIVAVMPASPEGSDYHLAVADMIGFLARREKRSEEEILTEILRQEVVPLPDPEANGATELSAKNNGARGRPRRNGHRRKKWA